MRPSKDVSEIEFVIEFVVLVVVVVVVLVGKEEEVLVVMEVWMSWLCCYWLWVCYFF